MTSFSAVAASLLIAISIPNQGNAQSATLTGPRLGYLFDTEEKTIRPLSGIPGAASLDSGISVASKLERAFISPNRKFALAQPREGGQILVITWGDGGSASANALDGSPAVADQIAF